MNYLKSQIKRTTRNRMILFGLLAAYFSAPVIAGMADRAAFGDIGLFIVMLVIFAAPAALFWFFFVCALVSNLNYTKSRQYKRLGGWARGSVEELNKLVSRELGIALAYSHKRLKLTANWVCVQLHFSIHIRPVETLIWVYKHVTNTNYSAPQYALKLSFRDQKQFHVRMRNEAQCDELLMLFAEKYPHILLGYTKPLYRTYKDNINEFMNIVQEKNARA